MLIFLFIVLAIYITSQLIRVYTGIIVLIALCIASAIVALVTRNYVQVLISMTGLAILSHKLVAKDYKWP